MIAFIAGASLSDARIDIRDAYQNVQMRNERHGSIEIDGENAQFVIITLADRLRGLELSDFVFLPSSVDLPARDKAFIRELATSRLRLPNRL